MKKEFLISSYYPYAPIPCSIDDFTVFRSILPLDRPLNSIAVQKIESGKILSFEYCKIIRWKFVEDLNSGKIILAYLLSYSETPYYYEVKERAGILRLERRRKFKIPDTPYTPIFHLCLVPN